MIFPQLKYKKQLLNLSKALSQQDHFNYSFTNKLPCGKGMTNDHISKSNRLITIGINNLNTETKFVHTLVTIFHEHTHAMQFNELQQNDTDDYSLMNHLSCHNNQDYYEQNYKYFITEIEAEYNGVTNAYNYLCQNKSIDEANSLITEYLKNSCRYNTESVCITSQQDIDGIFECAYNTAIHKTKWLSSYKSDDEIIKFLKENPDYEKPFDKTFDDGYERDKFIAAVELYYHPEYRDFYFSPAIKNLHIEDYLQKTRELPYIEESTIDQKGDEYE